MCSSLISLKFIGPQDYHINMLELCVAVLSFILIRKKVAVTKLLITAAMIGLFFSFI